MPRPLVLGVHCNRGHPLDTVEPVANKANGKPGRPTYKCDLCRLDIDSTEKYYSHCDYNCCLWCFQGKENRDLKAIVNKIQPADCQEVTLDSKEIHLPFHKCALSLEPEDGYCDGDF